jgi:GTP-binding protein HflX
MSQHQPDPAPGAEAERGFVVAVLGREVDADDELGELRELLRTAGVETVGELVQRRQRPDAATYVGKGKLDELKHRVADVEADSVIADDDLSPSQQRRLEDALKMRVIDRTQLILDIFAQHAVTAEGKLQVELAQLEYNLPRMRGMWQHLERLGGGIGTRGPGESQLETDRRLARRRVAVLKERLAALERQRATQRKARQRSVTPLVALAGYTNVGKSTLLNALTDAEVSSADRLFETLDPTTRAFEHDGRRYLVSDTVGFIRRLPHQLVEGFKATLEEMLAANLILHVADASAPEGRLDEQVRAVDGVLRDIGAHELPVELVLNKVDRVDELGRRRLRNRFPDALLVSALTGEGLPELRARVASLFSEWFEPVRLFVPHAEAARLSELYALGTPIDEREDGPDGVTIVARLPRREVPRFARFLVVGDRPAREAESGRQS